MTWLGIAACASAAVIAVVLLGAYRNWHHRGGNETPRSEARAAYLQHRNAHIPQQRKESP